MAYGDDHIYHTCCNLLGLFDDEFVLTLSKKGWCTIIQFNSTKAFWVFIFERGCGIKSSSGSTSNNGCAVSADLLA